MEPEHMANRTFAEYLDSEIKWDAERRGRLQNELHYSPHITDCSTARLPGAKPNLEKPYPHQHPPNQNPYVHPPGTDPSDTGNELDAPMHPPRPELAAYPNVHDYKPFAECPEKEKRLFMKR